MSYYEGPSFGVSFRGYGVAKGKRVWALGFMGSCMDPSEVLGGSWDLASKVISPLVGVISNYKYSYLVYNL